jgi:hypothetical protein
MHSADQLRSSSFRIAHDGRELALTELFDGFEERDRLGVVVRHPCGAVGASALITATVTAFYDIQRSRAPDFFIYPDYFLLHVGRRLGDHSMLDIWPSHKEVVVADDAERVLEAVNDRAVTRLVVEDGEPGDAPVLERETLASARARIAACLAYSPSGRVPDADVRIESNPVAESYVDAVLEPEAQLPELRAGDEASRAYAEAIAARVGEVDSALRSEIKEGRARLVEDDVTVETYRRIDLDEALALLAPVRSLTRRPYPAVPRSSSDSASKVETSATRSSSPR